MTTLGRLAGVLALVITATAPAPAAAQCPSLPGDAFAFITFGNGVCTDPGVRWPTQSVVYDCDFFADADKTIDCGGDPSTCVQLCHAATNVWNGDLAGRFTFVDHGSTPVTFCDTEDGITSVGGKSTLCNGTAFGARVLALTLSIFFDQGSQAGQLLDANIVVNQAFNGFFDQANFQATLAHEFGHVLGLAHPDQCNRDFNVLMRSASLFASSSPCFVMNPTADDLTGAEMIYPVIAATPTPNATPGLCGDADLSGAVTVTDGVATLRAAAGLSSNCTLTLCDVDGSGAITVSDGVNVLRAAAGLSSLANCRQQ